MTTPAPRTRARVPVGVDTTRPSIARVYDYSLGGKDNYDADRAAYEQILQVAPRQGDVSRMNRRWLHRVVRYLAGPAAVDQFLDIGAGLPTVANTHEVAQQDRPEARVVYVDNDPVCNAHGRVLLEQNDHTFFVAGDLLEDGTLLSNRSVMQYFDHDRPIAVIVCGLLHHIEDELNPAAVMREYVDQMPPGSYLAISHFWDPADEDPELHTRARQAERAFVEMGLGSGWFRTREQIREFFGGLALIPPAPLEPPGLVELDDWWPMGPWPLTRCWEQRLMLGGVAYKPDPAHEPVPLRARRG
ncbi:SAM-dependent methyltransferase [Nocardia sp. CA-290969]|uniref:SAM-dependent methyltransferase n=1 Tax=Nocardia sp. CA-290969 TaxID=3239986 RepID=UPI003D90B080